MRNLERIFQQADFLITPTVGVTAPQVPRYPSTSISIQFIIAVLGSLLCQELLPLHWGSIEAAFVSARNLCPIVIENEQRAFWCEGSIHNTHRCLSSSKRFQNLQSTFLR